MATKTTDPKIGIRLRDREQLRQVAAELGVSDDWHEPDGVTARLHGTQGHFDNAMGAGVTYGDGDAEMYVTLYKVDYDPVHDPVETAVASVSLATLFSWAASAHNETEGVRKLRDRIASLEARIAKASRALGE